MIKNDFLIRGTAKVIEKKVNGEAKFFLEILASTADIDLEDDVISGDALRGAQHDLLKNNTVLLGHDRDEILGATVESEFTPPKSLKLVLLISNTRPKEQQMIRENALNKASISGRMLNWVEKVDKSTGKPIRVITRIRLHEVSLVPLPMNQEARTLRWWVDKAGPVLVMGLGQEEAKGGDNENMGDENVNKDQPGDGVTPGTETPPDTDVVTGFTFDPSEVDAVGKNVQAEAKALEVREKMLHITGRLKAEAPDEGVAKAAEVLETLIGQLDIGIGPQKSEGEADSRLGKIEALLQDLKAGKVEGTVTGGKPDGKTPAKPKPGVFVIRRSAPPQGGEPADDQSPEDPDKALKAELKAATTREQKFGILRKYGRFSIKAA
jgi:hypothetical protein